MTWRAHLISFTVQYCFLFRFVCIELVSLVWFLQIWVAIYVYGTMINWSTLIKKLMQTYIVTVSGSILNVSIVRLNSIWHLIWRYLSKPVLGGHPILSGHYSIPRGCPLNTGFTVLKWKISPPFHVPQLVNSLLFDISEAWKKVPLSGGASLHGPLQGLPPASNVPYLALNNKLHETKGKSRWLFVLYHIIGQLSIIFIRLGLL